MTSASTKQQFLAVGNVSTIEQAARHSLQAAVKTRNPKYPVYIAGVFEDKKVPFRDAFRGLLNMHADRLRHYVSEDAHIAAIENISTELSRQHAAILFGGCLRIGIAQKAFNLYLKYLWCLDPTRPVPPHCPLDGIVLQAAGVPGIWTEMNSLAVYKEWISAIRRHVETTEHSSLSAWELDVWESSRPLEPRSRSS